MILSVLMLIGLGWYLRRSVIAPVRRVAEAADRLARGERGVRVRQAGTGEVERLGEAFNEMAETLSRREREVEASRDRLEGILRHASATVSVKDREGRYLLVNPSWERVCGRAAAEVIGATDADILPAEIAEAVRAGDVEVMRDGRVVEYEESYGGAIYHVTKFPLAYRDGTHYGVAVMGTDVTDRQRALARRGRGHALQDRVPGQHEPRDPHADERRDRHDRAAARHARSSAEQRELRRDRSASRRRAARRSSTTSSTSRRSRPASSSSRSSTSTCATVVEDVADLLAAQRAATRASSSPCSIDAGRARARCAAIPAGCARC